MRPTGEGGRGAEWPAWSISWQRDGPQCRDRGDSEGFLYRIFLKAFKMSIMFLTSISDRISTYLRLKAILCSFYDYSVTYRGHFDQISISVEKKHKKYLMDLCYFTIIVFNRSFPLVPISDFLSLLVVVIKPFGVIKFGWLSANNSRALKCFKHVQTCFRVRFWVHRALIWITRFKK